MGFVRDLVYLKRYNPEWLLQLGLLFGFYKALSYRRPTILQAWAFSQPMGKSGARSLATLAGIQGAATR